MNSRVRLFLPLVITLVVSGLRADDAAAGGAETPGLNSRIKNQLGAMIRTDAGIVGPLRETVAEIELAEADVEEPQGAMLELEPMIVDGQRVKPLPPPWRETRVQEVLRTGTVWEKVGARFTQRFWMQGDRGIMFTVSW
ncbi:MAG TPA: hypothetical protein VHN79_10395 [Lacunisphaera sp.]|nr:hypothetical protein [Lacunisphaera sp.]